MVRLAVEEPRARRIGALLEANEREAARPVHVHLAAPFEEDAFRPGKLFPHPQQIAALEREVPVFRQAVGEAVVGRLVTLESVGCAREIDGNGEAQEHDRDRS